MPLPNSDIFYPAVELKRLGDENTRYIPSSETEAKVAFDFERGNNITGFNTVGLKQDEVNKKLNKLFSPGLVKLFQEVPGQAFEAMLTVELGEKFFCEREQISVGTKITIAFFMPSEVRSKMTAFHAQLNYVLNRNTHDMSVLDANTKRLRFVRQSDTKLIEKIANIVTKFQPSFLLQETKDQPLVSLAALEVLVEVIAEELGVLPITYGGSLAEIEDIKGDYQWKQCGLLLRSNLAEVVPKSAYLEALDMVSDATAEEKKLRQQWVNAQQEFEKKKSHFKEIATTYFSKITDTHVERMTAAHISPLSQKVVAQPNKKVKVGNIDSLKQAIQANLASRNIVLVDREKIKAIQKKMEELEKAREVIKHELLTIEDSFTLDARNKVINAENSAKEATTRLRKAYDEKEGTLYKQNNITLEEMSQFVAKTRVDLDDIKTSVETYLTAKQNISPTHVNDVNFKAIPRRKRANSQVHRAFLILAMIKEFKEKDNPKDQFGNLKLTDYSAIVNAIIDINERNKEKGFYIGNQRWWGNDLCKVLSPKLPETRSIMTDPPTAISTPPISRSGQWWRRSGPQFSGALSSSMQQLEHDLFTTKSSSVLPLRVEFRDPIVEGRCLTVREQFLEIVFEALNRVAVAKDEKEVSGIHKNTLVKISRVVGSNARVYKDQARELLKWSVSVQELKFEAISDIKNKTTEQEMYGIINAAEGKAGTTQPKKILIGDRSSLLQPVIKQLRSVLRYEKQLEVERREKKLEDDLQDIESDLQEQFRTSSFETASALKKVVVAKSEAEEAFQKSTLSPEKKQKMREKCHANLDHTPRRCSALTNRTVEGNANKIVLEFKKKLMTLGKRLSGKERKSHEESTQKYSLMALTQEAIEEIDKLSSDAFPEIINKVKKQAKEDIREGVEAHLGGSKVLPVKNLFPGNECTTSTTVGDNTYNEQRANPSKSLHNPPLVLKEKKRTLSDSSSSSGLSDNDKEEEQRRGITQEIQRGTRELVSSGFFSRPGHRGETTVSKKKDKVRRRSSSMGEKPIGPFREETISAVTTSNHH